MCYILLMRFTEIPTSISNLDVYFLKFWSKTSCNMQIHGSG